MQNRFYIILFILLFCLACNKENAPGILKTTGVQTAISRKLAPFKNIEVWDEFDIVMIQDSQFFVEITAGKNLLPQLEATVVNNTLVLKNNNKFNWVRKLGQRFSIKVHCAAIDNFEIYGAATLSNRDTLVGNRVNINHSGTGNVNLIINCDWFTFRCANVGNITAVGSCGILAGTVEQTAIFDGTYFTSSDAYFYHYSLANSFIQADNALGLNIYGRGNLYYLKEPKLRKEINRFGLGEAVLR